MINQDKTDPGEILDGLVQLRFSDDEGTIRDINAAEMAEAIQGLVAFTSEMAKSGLFGDGVPPELRVRPPKQGSFIMEAIVMWAGANPEAAIGSAMTAGASVAQAVNVGIKKLRGDKVADFDHLDNGNVKVNWSGGGVNELPMATWKRLNDMKSPTRKALKNIMAPLSDDVDQLEVRDGSPADSTEDVLDSEPIVVATRSDYLTAAAVVDDVKEETETFDAEAELQNIDFRPGEKWLISTTRGTRRATMDDSEFLLKLDRGMALRKGDIFDVTISEERTTKNGRMSREWSLTNVVLKRRGGKDDNDEPSRAESSSTESQPTV